MSIRTHSSIRIPLAAETVWTAVRRFDFPSRLISTIQEVELEGGAGSTAVGVLRTVTWKSGEKQTARLLCVDDAFMTTRWELVAAEPAAEVTAMLSTLRVFPITEDGSSVLDWQSEFSADVSGTFLRFSQEAQLESLREIRALLTGGRVAATGGLKDIFASLRQGAKPSQAQLAAVWDKYDANHDGNLDVAETASLLTAVLREKRANIPAILQQHIEELGPAGLILGAMVLALQPIIEAALDQAERSIERDAADLRAKFDTNHDGRVTRDEFLAQAADLLFDGLQKTPAAQNLAPVESPLPEEGSVDCTTQ